MENLKVEVKEILEKIYERRIFPSIQIREKAFELYNFIYVKKSDLFPQNPRGKHLDGNGCKSCNIECIASLEKFIK